MKWTSTMKSITPKDFTHTVGPTVVIPDSPLGIFKLFFTVEILQYIVEQTNKYALECMGQPSFDSWQPLTVAELEAFMGFMLLMGIVNLPALIDYWKSDPVYHYTPIVSRISRTRAKMEKSLTMAWEHLLSKICVKI